MLYLRRARPILLVLILFLYSSATLAQAVSGPPYQWPRSHDYDVQHYKLELSFDWIKKEVAGKTTIRLRPFKDGLREIELDAGDMTIDSVKFTAGAALKFRYEKNEKLFIELDREYSTAQEISVTINYTAKPKDGLVFVTPDESTPNQPYQIWTAGEPNNNHYWFPCYDFPNDRATSETIVTVDEKYQVISNGRLVTVKPDPVAKTRTWHWKMTQQFPSYLISIVVGEFSEIKDYYKTKPIVSYVYRDQIDNARLTFANLGKMVTFFSDKIGLDYPYDKYAQTTVRGFPGALENITATTMSDAAVHDKRALLDSSADGVVSHELAHQWFGNLITCRNWGELWLNEGFATFFSDLWTEHSRGKDEYLYSMLNNQDKYFQTWSREERRRPIVTKRFKGLNTIFGTYAYQQSAAVINMLRFVLGEELFWKSINHYIKKHQGQSIETPHLILAIEEVTGQSLEWFFDEWIYKMGHPEFEIMSNYDEIAGKLRLKVKQIQKPAVKYPWYQSPDFFTMPVDIALTTASGEKIHRVWIDAPEKEFDFAVDSKPLIVNFDRGNYLIKKVYFDRSDEELAYQLLNDLDVMGRISAANELNTSHSEIAAKALGEAAHRDRFWGVRFESVRALRGFNSETARAGLIRGLEDSDARVRQAAVEELAEYKDEKLAELYIKLINTDKSYSVVAEAATALVKSGSSQAFDLLIGLVKQDSWQDAIRINSINGLATLKDSRALDLVLTYSKPGHNPSVRAAALQAIGTLGKGSDQAFNTLTAALAEPSSQINYWAIIGLGSLSDPRAIAVLEQFTKRSEITELNRSFSKSVIIQIRHGSVNKD
jgi:aminopeptidase N